MMPPISNGRRDNDASRRSAGRHAVVPGPVRHRRAVPGVPVQGALAGRIPVRGHDDAYTLKTKIVYECAACRKQHSLLAGTIFEQTKTGLAKWFLAIHLVTSSKGGIAATELKRQLGLGSYQTAWTWLHKLREAMVGPDREPLAGRVEADETHVGGPRPGKRGRGAAGKALGAGAVEGGGAEGGRL